MNDGNLSYNTLRGFAEMMIEKLGVAIFNLQPRNFIQQVHISKLLLNSISEICVIIYVFPAMDSKAPKQRSKFATVSAFE
jgi:hypothetical protein